MTTDRKVEPVDYLRILNAAKVLAALHWPCDELRRNRYVAVATAQLLGTAWRDDELYVCTPIDNKLHWSPARGRPSPRVRNIPLHQWLYEQWQEFAGPAAVVAAAYDEPLQDASKVQRRDWCTAGYILDLICRMHTHNSVPQGDASVNRAIHIVFSIAEGSPIIHQHLSTIWKVWEYYKPVAHLCAAYFVRIGKAQHSDDRLHWEARNVHPMFLGEQDFLYVGECYRQFGVTYGNKRTKGQTVLDPDKTLILKPSSFDDWPRRFWKVDPLSSVEIKACEGYTLRKGGRSDSNTN